MKIAIDGGVMTNESSTRGIGVYTKFLIKGLEQISKHEKISISVIDAKNTKNLSEFDLLHYPSFDFFFNTLPSKTKIPTVVTIHDTIPLLYPKHYPPGIKGKINLLLQRRKLSAVSAVITDSVASQKDIVRNLGVDVSNIFPIYLGPTKSPIDISKIQLKKALERYKIDYPYIVYIGDVNWNKNVVGLAEACVKEEIHLVVIGRKATDTSYDRNHVENAPLKTLQEQFAQSKYIHRLGYVEDNDATIIIKGSRFLCQPSFYEGFGLNVLDAMTLSVPTVCARTQTLVEIYESATSFFDPYNIKDMRTVIRDIFDSKKRRSDLVERGNKLSKSFSWKKTASETLQVYRSILR